MAEVTVLYDEGCGLCARLAMRLDGVPDLTAKPIGSTAGSVMLRDLSAPERYASLHVVDELGRRLSAGAALPPLLRRLPGGRPVAALCDALPGLAQHAYGLLARNRRVLARAGRRWPHDRIAAVARSARIKYLRERFDPFSAPAAATAAPRAWSTRVRDAGPQSTASRSTTNTSGSCGAITPPAPRAP